MAAPVINLIQRGQKAFNSATPDTVTLGTTVDASKSILFVSASCDETSTRSIYMAELTDGDTITFTPNSAGNELATIEWTVVEFSAGVSVQRGTIAPNTSLTATITAVTLANSFVVPGGEVWNSTSWSGNYSYYELWLSATTTVEVNVFGTTYTNLTTVPYQVVSFDEGITVERGTTTIAASTATKTQAITTVGSVDDCVVITTASEEGDRWATRHYAKQVNVETSFNSTSEILFTREGAEAGVAVIRWEVIEFTGDGMTVQDPKASMTTAETSDSVTITSVDTAAAFIIPQHHSPYGGGASLTSTASTDYDNAGFAQCRIKLTNATTVDFTRSIVTDGNGTSTAITCYGYVVEIAAAAAGTYPYQIHKRKKGGMNVLLTM